jgi:hypothetical protein
MHFDFSQAKAHYSGSSTLEQKDVIFDDSFLFFGESSFCGTKQSFF